MHNPRVSYRVPLWARAFLAADRLATRVTNVREGLRDELFLAFIPPSERADLTAALYAEQSTYLPGGHRFQSGLFAWEKRVFDSALFPKSGRILLGAAGAGRELIALLDRGFSVVAFDPCEAFVLAARRVASTSPEHLARATVVRASYADLTRAADSAAGPLAFLTSSPSFDAVILGWGSLSHVLPASERLALFQALHALAPGAPVLASFSLEPDSSAAPGSKGRVRDALRRLFAALGAPGPSEAGDHFYPDGGFFSNLSTDEIVELAFRAGYEVALVEDAPYPHAVLVPHGGHAKSSAPE
jgi:hypothetical protein